MAAPDFTTTILVDNTPQEVFNAINNVRGWWSESIEGNTDKLNEQFLYYYKDVHISKMKIIEFIPNKKVVWLVTESNLSFLEKTDEWNGTSISFEILPKNNKTEILFTHIGLVPEVECYDSCAPAWSQYVQERLLKALLKNK